MARPTDKAQLLAAAQMQYDNLIALVDSFSPHQQLMEFLFDDRDRNIRDVLGHLHEWHHLMAEWDRVGTKEGRIPSIPQDGYTWATLTELNRAIWEKYQAMDLATARQKLAQSHAWMLRLVQEHTNEELFIGASYPWTITYSLGSYFDACTAEHYEWAMEVIQRQKGLLENKLYLSSKTDSTSLASSSSSTVLKRE